MSLSYQSPSPWVGDQTRTYLFDKIGYMPHSSYQWDFHTSIFRFKVACCGRRFGKSLMSGHEMTLAMMDTTKPKAWYWIVGPQYKLGEKEFRVVWNDLQKLGVLKHCPKKSYNMKAGDMKIVMPWGTTLEVVSAEKKDSLQGEGLSGVIMSEAATHDPVTWEQYIRPALSDMKGWAIFPTTPKGFNWFYYVYLRGDDPAHYDWESWCYPSWLNPIVYPGGFEDPELQQIRKTTSTQWFEQEYGAKFTTFEGKIYSEFEDQYHVKDINYNPMWQNIWTFDWGWSAPFVCLDIMIDPSDNVYVWREYQVSHISTFEHARILKERPNPPGFHVDCMFGDPHGADEIATMALVLGQVWGRPVPWKQGIEAVKRHLKLQQPENKPKLFIDRSCVNLRRQMHTLRAKEISQYDRNPKEGQHDYDDHGPDALRYFFSEWFVLGAGSHFLASMLPNMNGAEGYFQYDTKSPFNMGDVIGF